MKTGLAKLYEILQHIEDRSLEVAATKADQDYIMCDIERLALLGKKVIQQIEQE